ALEQLLVNLQLLGHWESPLDDLDSFCRFGAEIFQVEVPRMAPIVGRDVFRTSSGVHAAAVIKAMQTGDADEIYSSIDASRLGRSQEIAIGPSSGVSNLRHWLAVNRESLEADALNALLQRVKESGRVLEEEELRGLLREVR
ncbi:MAG: 2-isopropylmalate synthase, partial [Myxococcota bacterium]